MQLAETFFSNQQVQENTQWSTNGWTNVLQCNPGGGPGNWYNQAFVACLGNQQISRPYQGMVSSFASMSYMNYTNCGGFPGLDYDSCPVLNRRGAVVTSWTRTPGGTRALPLWQAQIANRQLQNPNWNPEEVYPKQPKLDDKPIMRTRAQRLEYQAYVGQASGSPAPAVYLPPRPAFQPDTIPLNSPQPLSTEVGSGGVRNLTPSYTNTPFKGKERKVVISLNSTALGRVVAGAINISTETRDFVDAFFYALPYKDRPKWPDGSPKKLTVADKLKVIYEHYDSMKMDKLIQNLVANEIGDAIGGASGRLRKKAYRQAFEMGGQSAANKLQIMGSKAFRSLF